MDLRAILFDFDLTIADSTRGVEECVRCALKRVGLAVPDAERIRRTIGLSLSETFRALTSCSDSELERVFMISFVERADEVMADLTSIFPEVGDERHVRRRIDEVPLSD